MRWCVMITISRDNYQKMLTHAKKNLPEEACGLIAGVIDGAEKRIQKVYLLTNIDHSSEHFSLDPREQLSAIKDMREKGLQLLGNWHSHPESPARPSEEDKRLAFDSSASYLIVSFMLHDLPIVRSFHIENGNVTDEGLAIEP